MLGDQPGSAAAAAPDTEPAPMPPVPSAWDEPEWPADDDSPGSEESSARRHRRVLAASLIVLLLSFAMVEVPGGRVAVRGLTAYPLPPSCVSRTLLGLNCPGCGLTRSFIHLAEGDWAASWRCHRLGGLLAAVLILQVPYRLVALRRHGRPLIPTRWQGRLGLALIALLIVNWLADVVTGRVASL
jgi:hypothetical protein